MDILPSLDLEAPSQPAKKTFTLRAPVKHRGGTISEINLREPNVAQVIGATSLIKTNEGPESLTEYIMTLASSVSGLKDPSAFDNVLFSELKAMGEYMDHFVTAGLRGENAAAVEPNDVDPTWDMQLDEEITVNGISYHMLPLQEATTLQLKKAQQQLKRGMTDSSFRNFQMHLVANVTGYPISVIGALPISVLNFASSYIQVFIVGGPRTGLI